LNALEDEDGAARLEKARQLVKRYTAVGAAPGLIPLPLVDLGLIFAVQVKMVHHLAGLYGVPFQRQRTVSLLSALVGGGFSVSLGASLSRAVPVLGSFTAPATVIASGGLTTWAAGQVFIQHFESGGTFLSFDPDKVRDHYTTLIAQDEVEIPAEVGPRRP